MFIGLLRGGWKLSAGLALAAGLSLPATVWAQHEGHGGQMAMPGAATKPADEWKGDPYLLNTDPVSGQKLGDKPVIYQQDGRELRFASEDTLKQFKAEPAKYLTRVDEQMIQQQLPLYPLDTCLVTPAMRLGSMGKPVDEVYKNRLVRFCSKADQAQFDKDPAKYIPQLDQAVIAKQKAKYAATACPVSKDKLGGEMGKPVDLVVGNRLVELCCKSCVADFNKDPLKYLAMIGDAPKANPAPAGAPAGHQGHAGMDHSAHSGHMH